MRRLAPILVLLVLAGLAAVALAGVDHAPAARLTAIATSGSFEVLDSRAGEPIFTATNIGPGRSARGTVTIEDTGSTAATLVLRQGDLLDAPGLGGATLSDRLRMSVVDITVPAAPRTVYSGPLATMPDQPAGVLAPGESHTFEFVATLPDTGQPAFQNAVQGATTTVAYAWIAAETSLPGGGEGGGGGPGGGGGAGGTPVGNGDTGPSGSRPVLELTVPKILHALHGGRLVAWARCDRSCRLTVAGRLRASAAGHHAGVRIRLREKRLAPGRAQRLRIPVPRRLRSWLRHQPSPAHMRAKLRFTALAADGESAVALKKPRLWAGRH